MKKWTFLLFAFYILISTVIPCSMVDHCDEEMIASEETNHSDQNEDCTSCSPFSICSSSSGIVADRWQYTCPEQFYNIGSIAEIHSTPCCGYCSSLFQPPRGC